MFQYTGAPTMKRQLPARIGLAAAVLVGLHGCGVSFGPYPVPAPLVEITAAATSQPSESGTSGGSSLTDQQIQDLLDQLAGGQ